MIPLVFSQPFSSSIEPSKIINEQLVNKLSLIDSLAEIYSSLSDADNFLNLHYVSTALSIKNLSLPDSLDLILSCCNQYWSTLSLEDQPVYPELAFVYIVYGALCSHLSLTYIQNCFRSQILDYRDRFEERREALIFQYQQLQRVNFDWLTSTQPILSSHPNFDSTSTTGPERARAFQHLWQEVIQHGLIIQKKVYPEVLQLGNGALPALEDLFCHHRHLTPWKLGQIVAMVWDMIQSSHIAISQFEIQSVADVVANYANLKSILEQEFHWKVKEFFQAAQYEFLDLQETFTSVTEYRDTCFAEADLSQ